MRRPFKERNASVATHFLDSLERVLHHVARNPRRYRQIDPKLHQPGTNCRLRHALIYRVDPSEGFILAVKHDRRQPDYWRLEPKARPPLCPGLSWSRSQGTT